MNLLTLCYNTVSVFSCLFFAHHFVLVSSFVTLFASHICAQQYQQTIFCKKNNQYGYIIIPPVTIVILSWNGMETNPHPVSTDSFVGWSTLKIITINTMNNKPCGSLTQLLFWCFLLAFLKSTSLVRDMKIDLRSSVNHFSTSSIIPNRVVSRKYILRGKHTY